MTRDLTQGSPVRLILSFAVPLLAGMLFQQMYALADAVIVGRFVGVNALAGVGATGSVCFLVLGFCMGICMGFVIPVAQQFGAKEEGRMREYVANAIWLSAGAAVILTVLTMLFCRHILIWMNTPQECFEEAYDYLLVSFAGIPTLFLYNLLSGFLRSLGDSKTPLFFLVLSSVLNIVLDLVLILVFHMGVFGASLASVMSQGVSGALCLLWIGLKFPILHVRGNEWKPRAERMAVLCSYGVPMGMQYSVTAIGSVVLQTAVNSLGAIAVAAVAAGSKVLTFFNCPFDALGSTMATYSAQNVGAGRYERLNKGVLSAALVGTAYSLCALAVMGFCGPKLIALFVTGEGNAQMIDLAQRYIMVTVVFYVPLMLVNIIRFAIQGMGFSAFAIISGLLEMAARSLAGLLLVPALGFLGASLGSPLAWIFADTFLIPAYFHCRRQVITRAESKKLRKNIDRTGDSQKN